MAYDLWTGANPATTNHDPPIRQPMALSLFIVVTTAGRFEVKAASASSAINAALYFGGRGTRVIKCHLAP